MLPIVNWMRLMSQAQPSGSVRTTNYWSPVGSILPRDRLAPFDELSPFLWACETRHWYTRLLPCAYFHTCKEMIYIHNIIEGTHLKIIQDFAGFFFSSASPSCLMSWTIPKSSSSSWDSASRLPTPSIRFRGDSWRESRLQRVLAWININRRSEKEIGVTVRKIGYYLTYTECWMPSFFFWQCAESIEGAGINTKVLLLFTLSLKWET